MEDKIYCDKCGKEFKIPLKLVDSVEIYDPEYILIIDENPYVFCSSKCKKRFKHIGL